MLYISATSQVPQSEMAMMTVPTSLEWITLRVKLSNVTWLTHSKQLTHFSITVMLGLQTVTAVIPKSGKAEPFWRSTDVKA